MIDYILPPFEKVRPNAKTLFTAGSITGAPNWQYELFQLLQKSCDNLLVFNPRRPDEVIFDAEEQIKWEWQHLNRADAISFWFAKGAPSIISFYELGSWIHSKKKIFVGADFGFERIADITFQLELARPDIKIANTLPRLAKQISEWVIA